MTRSSWPGWTGSCFRTSISTRQRINCTAKSRRSIVYSSSERSNISDALLWTIKSNYFLSRIESPPFTCVWYPLCVLAHTQASTQFLAFQTRRTEFSVETEGSAQQLSQKSSATGQIGCLLLFEVILKVIVPEMQNITTPIKFENRLPTKGSAMTCVIFLSAWIINSANKFCMTYSPGFNDVSTWICVGVVSSLSFLVYHGNRLLLDRPSGVSPACSFPSAATVSSSKTCYRDCWNIITEEYHTWWLYYIALICFWFFFPIRALPFSNGLILLVCGCITILFADQQAFFWNINFEVLLYNFSINKLPLEYWTREMGASLGSRTIFQCRNRKLLFGGNK